MLIGHNHILERFDRMIRNHRAARSFLFVGPEHVGKLTVARLVALQFLGLSSDEYPDEDRMMQIAPDCIVLSPERVEEKGRIREKSIGIEMVREAIHLLSLSPQGTHGKVLIVENVGKLSEESQNALLKTAEEPKAGTLILLVAHEEGAALSTLVSRCERVSFSFVSSEEMQRAFPDADPVLCSLGRPGFLLADTSDELLAEDLSLLRQLFRPETMPVFERLGIGETLSGDLPRAERIFSLLLGMLQSALPQLSDFDAVRTLARAAMLDQVLRTVRHSPGSARMTIESFLIS